MYFGPWSEPDGALKKYEDQKDDLHAGRKPKEEVSAGVTVRDLCNNPLNAQQALVDVGALSPRTSTDYKAATDLIVSNFGKSRLLSDVDVDDFAELRNKMPKSWGPHRLGKVIQCSRCVFKYGYADGLLAVPVRYGPGFKGPSTKTLRLNKAKKGVKLFTTARTHLGRTLESRHRSRPRLVLGNPTRLELEEVCKTCLACEIRPC